MHRASQVLVPGLLAVSVACAEAPPEAAAPLEPVVAVETLSLGSVEDGPQAFGRVTGLLEDPGGRILVADYQADEIRVFSREGDHLYSFGGRGAGPGELAGPCCIAWSPDGSLWVRDTGNQRYSGFDVGESDAVFLSTTSMHHTDGNNPARTTFTSAGDLIDVGSLRSSEGAGRLVRFIRGADGAISHADTLRRATPEDLGGFTVSGPGFSAFFYPPHGARELIAHGPGGRWAHAISSSYEVILREGESSRRLSGEASRPALSSAERESARQWIELDAERAGRPVRQMPYGVPETKVPLRALFFDADGRLWVELNRPDGDPRVADVWSAEGELIRRVQWPADVDLALHGWVGAHSALGVRRDDLGVEHVVRLAF